MAGAASALFLLDIKGRVIIWRDYSGDVSALDAERFFTKLIEKQVHSFFRTLFLFLIPVPNLVFVQGRSAISKSGCARQRRDLHVHSAQQRLPHYSHHTELNAASLLFFLHRIVDVRKPSRLRLSISRIAPFVCVNNLPSVFLRHVFKHYFEELEEESLRDNFVIVYELLDEIMDFGYPQYTEAQILSEFIKTDAYRMEVT